LFITSSPHGAARRPAVPHGRHPADRWTNRAPRRDVRDRRVRGLLGHRAQPRSGGNAIMLRTLKCPVIALEEHYWDKELAALFVGAEGVRDPEMPRRLYDLGELRLKAMDEAGIDVQILSPAA